MWPLQRPLVNALPCYLLRGQTFSANKHAGGWVAKLCFQPALCFLFLTATYTLVLKADRAIALPCKYLALVNIHCCHSLVYPELPLYMPVSMDRLHAFQSPVLVCIYAKGLQQATATATAT